MGQSRREADCVLRQRHPLLSSSSDSHHRVPSLSSHPWCILVFFLKRSPTVCFDNLPFLLVLLPCSFFPPFLLSRSSRHRRIPYNASVVVLQQVFPSCRVGGIRPHPSCTCSSTTTWVSKKMRRAMLQLLEHLAPPRTISWPSTSCLLQHPSRMAGCVFSKLFSSAHLFLCGTFSNRPLLLAF